MSNIPVDYADPGTDAAPVPPGPAPAAALRRTFLAWPRVQAALEEAERLRSA